MQKDKGNGSCLSACKEAISIRTCNNPAEIGCVRGSSFFACSGCKKDPKTCNSELTYGCTVCGIEVSPDKRFEGKACGKVIQPQTTSHMAAASRSRKQVPSAFWTI